MKNTECIDFITDVNNQDTFVIISLEFSHIIIHIVQEKYFCLYFYGEQHKNGYNNGPK